MPRSHRKRIVLVMNFDHPTHVSFFPMISRLPGTEILAVLETRAYRTVLAVPTDSAVHMSLIGHIQSGNHAMVQRIVSDLAIALCVKSSCRCNTGHRLAKISSSQPSLATVCLKTPPVLSLPELPGRLFVE